MAERAKILLVDDDLNILTSTSALLETMGYDVAVVSKPSGIAPAIRIHQPALVLQDIRMRGLDIGVHLDALKRDPATTTVPVVLFSAHPEVAKLAALHDVAGYLAKPFDQDQLSFLLGRILGPAAPVDSTHPRTPHAPAFRTFWNELDAMHALVEALKTGRIPAADGKALDALGRALKRLERAALGIEERDVAPRP